MKQTAVEFFKMQLEIRSGLKEITVGIKTFEKLFNKAKEIENQQKSYSEEDIINALHSLELQDNKDYSKIFNGMKEWFEKSKNKKTNKI